MPEEIKARDGKGVQAYRWIVLAGIGGLGILSMRVLDKIDKTADLASSLQNMVGALNGRLDAQADRITGQDGRIVRIENHVFFGSKNP